MGKLYDQYLVEMDMFYEYQKRRNKMIFVKVDEWGKCQICGHNGHIRFGVCGFCIEVWESQGKWEWDKDNPNLAKITCNGKVWYYEEKRPDKMAKKGIRDYKAIKKASQEHANHRTFICDYFQKGGIGAEIGVLYGQFSKIILRVAKPELLYLVDPWSHDDKFGSRTPAQMNCIAMEVYLKYLNNKKVEICRSSSEMFFRNARECFKIKHFDFIYIDGSHEFENVLSDLRGAWEIVKPGGIIAGDDYGENIPLWGNSIKRAVDDFCKERDITPEIIDVPGEVGKQFLIRR